MVVLLFSISAARHQLVSEVRDKGSALKGIARATLLDLVLYIFSSPAIAWVVTLSKCDCSKLRPCSIIDDVLLVTSRTRLSPFFVCNIKKVGGAWV